MDGTDSEMEKLFRAATRGETSVDAIREFLKKYPGKVDACALGGGRKTCLQVAAHEGRRELCTLLLDAGASLGAVDLNKNTPLHYAAFGNQPDIMELLLSRGAAINAVNKDRRSALHVAVINQHVQCVGVLLLSINALNLFRRSVLHVPVINQHVQCVRVLLQYHCDVNLQDWQGYTPLHHVADGNQRDIMELLLSRGAFVNAVDNNRRSALHKAVINQHVQYVRMLLRYHCDVNLQDSWGHTPLHLATWRGHWSLVELLVHHNADIGSTDEDGNTVLHIAIAKSPNQQAAVPTPESSRESPLIYAIWQNLARQGAKTELALACFLVSVDRSCKLLEQVRNKKNKTPLDLLEGNPQAALLADLLRSFKYQSHSTQLEIENPPTGYVEPPTYRIDNISQSEGLRGAKNIAGSGDAAECRDCSGIIADAKQENRFDPSSSVTLVGCARCGHTVVKTQAIQDGQLATGEVSIANPEDVPSEGKRKEEIGDREKEKDKDLERLRYLETRVADLEEANMCSICMERRRNVAFLCGHGACEHCAAPLKTCHMCRKTITKKINLY